jgi:hypothetical protein
MERTERSLNDYDWLFKHLIKNGSKPKGNTYWIYIPSKDLDKILTQWKSVKTIPIPNKDYRLTVIEAYSNYFVLNDH